MRHRNRMIELTSKEKAELRNVAQRLKPAIHVGKAGVTEGVLRELNLAFKENELIKVAFNADRHTLVGLAESVAEGTRSVCVGGVGKRRSFYRPLAAESEDESS